GGYGWGVFGTNSAFGNSSSIAAGNYFITGVNSAGIEEDALTATTNDFIPSDAYNIDAKIDDGLPESGTVQSVLGHATVLTTSATRGAAATSGRCNDTGQTPTGYQFTATGAECVLVFKMQTF